MLVRINNPKILVTVLLLTGFVTGCSDSDLKSSFVYSDATQSLIREAREGMGDSPGVEQLVDERFGDPQHLRVWGKLPLEAGGVFGRISAAPDASGAVKELTVTFDEAVEPFEEGETRELQFISGDAASTTVAVADWDAEGNVVKLSNTLDVVPSDGDLVVIGGGSVLQHGRVLYMRHCSHCHGTSGDGGGPTAEYLNPRPRDYRHGVFKFTSTDALSKVSRDDLGRVLKNGVPGTYMPSFVPMLKDDELTAVIEYVRFLAMRGEFERKLVSELASDYSQDAVASRIEGNETRTEIVGTLGEFLDLDMADSLEFIGDDMQSSWTNADTEDAVVTPGVSRVADTVESRRIGRNLYLSKEINCLNCHGFYGKGDGPQSTDFEKNTATGEVYGEAGLHDAWGNINQPRNLTEGIYRGGRRPIDIFRRINAGIKGTAMPSFSKNLTDEQTWHIVNYVLSIPFEPEPGNTAEPVAESSTASL